MTDPDRALHLGWGRLLDGGRLVPAFAIVAIGSLLLGLGLARFIQPPSATSSRSVTAGFITAVVERKTLRNEVVGRADASFADAVKISTPSGLAGAAIVTGKLPAVGDHVSAMAVVAEVSGRPIILLQGAIPSYRTLSFGLTGSDVLQLKRALVAVGISPGDADSDVYDAKTATAVGMLYQRVGYAPAVADQGSDDQLRSAHDAVVAAQDSLDSANRALAKAKNALTPQGRIEQNNLVDSAQRAEQAAQRSLNTAQAALTAANDAVTQARAANTTAQQIAASSPGSSTARANAAAALAALNDALQRQLDAANSSADAADALANAHNATVLALADRAAALADPDTSDETAAVTSAQHGLASARAALTSATNAALPILPSGEVAFVTQLPRRVDAVTATVGSPAAGPLLTLSGADLALVASVSASDSALLKVGDQATFSPADGGPPIKAKVSSIEATASPGSAGTAGSGTDGSGAGAGSSGGAATPTDSRMSVTLAPQGLTDQQVRALDGSNVRVTIPVGATSGNVLAVPIAAVSLGAGGASRVQVVDQAGVARFVEVTTGLVAQGDVEISSASGSIRAGDRVVVGK